MLLPPPVAATTGTTSSITVAATTGTTSSITVAALIATASRCCSPAVVSMVTIARIIITVWVLNEAEERQVEAGGRREGQAERLPIRLIFSLSLSG